MSPHLVTSCPAACEAQDTAGNLPLHIVLSQAPDVVRVESVVERVLRAFPGGCTVKNKDGDLPLHVAVKHQAPAEITMVVMEEHTETIKEVDGQGDNVVHCMLKSEHASVELVEAGLDPYR